jgi:hypothetical protein
MKRKENQFRQGDVAVTPVTEIPADAVAVPEVAGRIVLQYGEVTGHAHAFYGQAVTLYQTPRKERFLRVVKTSLLRHEEHAPIKVPPGLYRLPTQTEWTDAQEPMAVAD